MLGRVGRVRQTPTTMVVGGPAGRKAGRGGRRALGALLRGWAGSPPAGDPKGGPGLPGPSWPGPNGAWAGSRLIPGLRSPGMTRRDGIKDVVVQLAGPPARRWVLLRTQLRPTERGSGPPENNRPVTRALLRVLGTGDGPARVRPGDPKGGPQRGPSWPGPTGPVRIEAHVWPEEDRNDAPGRYKRLRPSLLGLLKERILLRIRDVPLRGG